MTGRALLLAALLLPGTALARPDLVLGLRLAFAPALLEAADRLPLAELVASQVPVQAEALWRIDRRLAAGAYASYGLGQPGAAACGGASCGARSIRTGLQLHLRTGAARFGGEAWLGAGAGWEWLAVSRELAGSVVTTGLHGPEAFFEGGMAWRAGERLSVGPYLLLAAGSYGRASLDAPGGSASAAVPDRSLHLWLHAGVRGTFELSTGHPNGAGARAARPRSPRALSLSKGRRARRPLVLSLSKDEPARGSPEPVEGSPPTPA